MTMQGPTPADGPSQECGQPADEACEVCLRPTCPDDYAERGHLGLCRCCAQAIESSGLTLRTWPHRLRAPFPVPPPSQVPSRQATEFKVVGGSVILPTEPEPEPD
jgi:hypothetical protein